MKRHLVRISMITALAAAGSYAQEHPPLKAEIPFDFAVGKTTLPAGQYVVDASSSTAVVAIRSSHGTANVMILGMNASSDNIQSTGKLVFHCYGSRCFLSQVWTPGSDRGRELRPSAMERELSANRSTPPTEALVALR